MNNYYSLEKASWDKAIELLLPVYDIYATIESGQSQDYELLTEKNVGDISYNKPKPATPIKSFFLPVRENVTADRPVYKKRIIIGTPNCDIEALGILDEIYLDESFEDKFYRQRREDTLLISSDCFDTQEHCHCLSYNIKPYSDGKSDLSVIRKNDNIYLRVITEKGKQFVEQTKAAAPVTEKGEVAFIEIKHHETEDMLARMNKGLPDSKATGILIKKSDNRIWKKYSETCVSCGACTAICPTCTCFLLIDKPGFHKLKQMDACQYPGFERVAGGEDALGDLTTRFINRYMCKYVWKSLKFKSIACTGCGRCIETCIGRISKNEIFKELAK